MGSAPGSDVPAERLKPILEVLDRCRCWMRRPSQLLEWAAAYYHHPIGEVAAGALPKALRRGRPSSALSRSGPSPLRAMQRSPPGQRAGRPSSSRLLGVLAAAGDAGAELLGEHLPAWREAARALRQARLARA